MPEAAVRALLPAEAAPFRAGKHAFINCVTCKCTLI